MKDYDYSTPGAYFITTCVQYRINVFGSIENGVMQLNDFGKIIEDRWRWLFEQYEYVTMGEYCVMPNHFHGIIWIQHVGNGGPVGNGRDRSLQGKIKPIPELVGAFKTTSSKLIHNAGNINFKWQKSYFEHIIRDEQSYQKIAEYIQNNPANWSKDDYHEH